MLMSRNASCSRGVPAAQVFETPRQVTELLDEKGMNGSEATQHSHCLGYPIEDAPLQQAQNEIEREAQQANQGDGEENQRRVEGIAGHHDHLSEAIADAG